MIRKVWGDVIFFFLIVCFPGYSNIPDDGSLLTSHNRKPIHSTEKVTIIRNSNGLIPFMHLDTCSFASLIIGDGQHEIFQSYLGKYAPFKHFQLNEIDLNHSKFIDEMSRYDILCVGIYDFPGKSSEVLQFFSLLSDNVQLVVSVFGPKWKPEDFREFDHLVWALDDTEQTNLIIPQILFGALSSWENHPVSELGDLSMGNGIFTESIDRISFAPPEAVEMDSETLHYLDSLGEELVREKAAPGCQIIVSRKGTVVYERYFGYHTYDSLINVNEQTLYDIASITKVAATVQTLMFMYGEGMIDLDKKASYYLEELKATNKENITIRELMTHEAGLRPYFPFYKYTKTRNKLQSNYYSDQCKEGYSLKIAPDIFAITTLPDSVWKWTIEYELRKKDDPLKPYDYQYSDMGYYILHHLIESQINQPMEEFLEQQFYHPLGLQTITYNPLHKFPLERITPTETDVNFRKSLLQGLVHDESAAMFGGVAGHAGLFSSALDLVILMQMNLQDGHYGGVRYLAPGVVTEFTQKQYLNNRRGLGWDKPESKPKEYNPVSWFSSSDTYGHSGFTGTSVWVDPEYELVYVFLSNRIYPDRDNKKLVDLNFRTRIQNILYDSIFKYSED